MLITVNDPDFVPMEGYELMEYNVDIGEVFINGENASIRSDTDVGGLGWGTRGNDIPLLPNQFVDFREIYLDPSIDLSEVDSFQITVSDVSRMQAEQKPDSYSGTLDTIWEDLDEEHVWTLTIPLDGTYKNYTYEMDQSYYISEYPIYVKKIQVTPSALILNCDRVGGNDVWECGKEKSYLLMSDGRKLSFNQAVDGMGLTQTSGEELGSLMYWFKVPLDTEQIIGVDLNGQEILFK